MDPQSTSPPLRRELGLFEVTLSGVGIILGAGVYVLIGQAAGLAGNALWFAFGLSAIMALLTGLSYAELSSMFPKAGAEYDYVAKAFNARLAFVIGWLVFLSGVLAAATVALGFAGYFSALTGLSAHDIRSRASRAADCSSWVWHKETARFAVISTLIEISGLVIIIAIGLPHLGSVNYGEMPQGFSGLFAASALIFFAYQGFESMVKFSEETKSPETTIPKALIFAFAICVVLYILVALSVVSVLGWQQLSVSKAPFIHIVSSTLGPGAAILIAIIALFATANTALMSMYASSRILFGMAGSSRLTSGFAWVHPGTRTPWTAILLCGILSIALIFAGDIAFIANVTNFTLFVTFIVINAAVIVLRYHSPESKRPFRIPFSIGRLPLIPLAGLLFCIFLLAQQELPVLGFGVVLTGIGVVLLIISGSAVKKHNNCLFRLLYRKTIQPDSNTSFGNNGNTLMAKKSWAYIWQFVIGLGLLSGIWTAIGIDPGAVILNVLGNMVGHLYSDPGVRSLLLILPTILLVISLIGAYRRGRVLGLISVIVAYISGLFILVSIMISVILLIIAIITGYLATNQRMRRKLTGA